MFNILLYKKVPFVIIYFLLDAYIRQEARVIWNSCKSQYFRVKNGVKQGGVISQILFNLYIDRLLLCLQRSGLGCHISNTYMGALSYADDITLISPSLYGLNRMSDICNNNNNNIYLKSNIQCTYRYEFSGLYNNNIQLQ